MSEQVEAVVLSPDGSKLFSCNWERVSWYLERNLAEVLTTEPAPVVRLFGEEEVNSKKKGGRRAAPKPIALPEDEDDIAFKKEEAPALNIVKESPTAAGTQASTPFETVAFDMLLSLRDNIFSTPSSASQPTPFPDISGAPEAPSDSPSVPKTRRPPPPLPDTALTSPSATPRRRVSASHLQIKEEHTAKLAETLQKRHADVCARLKRPNVLLAGASGAGKSQLVNGIFGAGSAVTGAGAAVTQGYCSYGEDEGEIVLYDCKGLEHGRSEEFVEATRVFLAEHACTPEDPARGIHCVWYVINAGETRVDNFTFDLMRDLYKDTRLICVLNKADLITSDALAELEAHVRAQGLPCVRAVIPTVADRTILVRDFSKCPHCGGAKLVRDYEDGVALCKKCGAEEPIAVAHNLGLLVAETLKLLPDVVGDAFVGAQLADLTLKDVRARKLIESHVAACTADGATTIVELLAKLAALFDLLVTPGMWEIAAETLSLNNIARSVTGKIASMFSDTQAQRDVCLYGVATYFYYRVVCEEKIREEAAKGRQAGTPLEDDPPRARKLYEDVLERTRGTLDATSVDGCLRACFKDTYSAEEVSPAPSAQPWWKMW